MYKIKKNARIMKTLEQAALDSEHPDSFKAGVEFARQWISTEEELPQNSDGETFYLLKLEGNKRIFLAAFYRNNLFWSPAYIKFENVVFWRKVD
jgi:hypothetical protein